MFRALYVDPLQTNDPSNTYFRAPTMVHFAATSLKQKRERKIKKVYLAVTTNPVPLGMHVHWMWGALNARGQRGGTPCQFVSHVVPESRKKAKASSTVVPPFDVHVFTDF